MAQTTVSIRIDDNLKKQTDFLLEEFGMNFSTAVTVFAKAVVRENRIPFAIESYERNYNEETRQAIEDANNGRNLHGPYDSWAEAEAEIMAEIAAEESMETEEVA